ncbi:MAG: CHAD domain-containing protein [Alphaproteobacteria bacterium]
MRPAYNPEFELKLSLDEATAAAFAERPWLHKLVKGEGECRHLVSVYFDTPRHALRKAGMALRIRVDGDRRVQTLKAPIPGPAGIQSHAEWTADVEGDRPDLTLIGDDDLRRRLVDRGYSTRLRPMFVTDFVRRRWRVKGGGATVELALDIGEIRATSPGGAPAVAAIREVELELLSGKVGRLHDLALRLCEAEDVQPGHQTKAERGYLLLQQRQARSVKAEPVALSPDATVWDGFDAVAKNGLRHLLMNEAAARRGDPEGIHQFRVAIRRLRATLRAFKAMLPYASRKGFNGELRWLQQRLGPARDWHVFLDETLPEIVPDDANGKVATHLRRLARRERRDGLADAAAILGNRRYARLLLHLQRWLAHLPEEDEAGGLKKPLARFARQVLDAAHKDLLRCDAGFARMSSSELHRLRILAKKLRYASEFFRSLYPGAAASAYIRSLARLQDRLGRINDAEVARQMVAGAKEGRVLPEAERLVRRWSDARIRSGRRKLAPFWRRFAQQPPFWRD